MAQISENIKKLLAESKVSKAPLDDEDEADSAVLKLQKEIEEFRKLKLQLFADNVRNNVKAKNYGATFDQIIGSQQWDDYLKSSAYGHKIATLYRNAIEEQNPEAVVYFFDDIASKYLKGKAKAETEAQRGSANIKSKKESLDDLAVPSKSKATKSPRKRKYDYEENDYADMLEKVERGKISYSTFTQFDSKFNKALSEGRVKPS